MKIARTIAELRQILGERRGVLVPTMGNLHQGHLSLIALAHEHSDAGKRPVVASIFVNPLQFAPTDDFDQYPRTFDNDCQALEQARCDVLFAPDEAALYPSPQTFRIQPDPALADILEGASRPGFFAGVCTVVMKLFQCVQPSAAVFGKKDYQQLQVIARMIDQFALPIKLVAGETLRESNGLAMSSRNGFLSDEQRAQAAALQRSLLAMRDQVLSGQTVDAAVAAAQATQRASGLEPDYVGFHHRQGLLAMADPQAGRDKGVILAAAKLGSVRLIDNLEF